MAGRDPVVSVWKSFRKSSGARAPRIWDWLKQEASFTMSVPSAWPLMRTFTPVVGNRVELYAMLRAAVRVDHYLPLTVRVSAR
jgi:hypothetical protein